MHLTDTDMRSVVESVKGISTDSREVRQGYLFAALEGVKFDGHDYIKQAILNGATHILAREGTEIPAEHKAFVKLITSDNPRKTLSEIAALVYAGQPDYIVAVTGTNGKTSTAHFAKQLWKFMGEKSASIGTLGVASEVITKPGTLTTMDPIRLHSELADLAAAGINKAAIEASSHGLDQNRLDGVRIKAGGFTNLTRDHLDYHVTEENYFNAKARLFKELIEDGGAAVINADVPQAKKLIEIAKARGLRVLDFGKNADYLKLVEDEVFSGGYHVKLSVNGKSFDVDVPLVGEFQVMNVLCAVGLVLSEFPDDAVKIEEVLSKVPELKGAPGRLQHIQEAVVDADIYVDYAHAPDGLETVLKSLRPHARGRLICVFGCGGDRDRGKRPMMGRIAEELADISIVTDDNPRSEEPAAIRAEILAAAPSAIEIGSRAEAIQKAVSMLEDGDVLVVAGKGHEQGQTIAGVTHHFDDVEEVKKAVSNVLSLRK